ncbi:glycoprotein [Cavenderia fasciculata]|uniref:Glycoprotein n=1 Tax=Cavenderia fasciculata TaxID=261658 RepID=F4QA48_CACFS|nr:glycoprotein [Cavenderia fasciculata]EGG15567.1 glycoprotein [Cavenderia fasciculata]|eukprot:XP_004354309.1 glycoprotein [Cavenderia fasciculata]
MSKHTTMVIQTEQGEGRITGDATIFPAPRITPPPFFIRFLGGYKTEGLNLWNDDRLAIASISVTRDGQIYPIPSARGGSRTDSDDGIIDFSLYLNEIPTVALPTN